MDMLCTLCLLLAVGVVTIDLGQAHEKFDHAFLEFLKDHGYRGGAVAAMRAGRLLHARGYGQDRAGRQVTGRSHFQVSSLAKSITAVAVLRLVQDGKLSLDAKVFGPTGVLSDLTPWKQQTADPHLHDVTVDQLLRHGAGWDSSAPPLYDPLLNTVYLDRGHKVPDIAAEMGLTAPLSPRDLISYVMSQPLTFTPGTKVAYSNMAYLVLGRVVAAVAGMEYRDYVKRTLLDRCGMWSTRLEMPPGHQKRGAGPALAKNDESVYEQLDPVAIDSALGWFSNVYDIMRFSRCIFVHKQLLDDHHLELLRQPLESAEQQHGNTWDCAGFRTNSRGGVWAESDHHTDDLVLYHNVTLVTEPPLRHDRPDMWVVLLHGRNLNHIRTDSRKLMALLDPREDEDGAENLFLYDLSDLHQHNVWEPPRMLGLPQYCIRYRVDEHHLSAYVRAVQTEGFDLAWFASYTLHGHTYFLLIGRRSGSLDFLFQHGLNHRTLLHQKLHLEERGFNLTQLHSYRSPHRHEPASFAAVFRANAFSADTQMKYGTGHLPEPYEKLVQMYHEKKFHPLSQTVVYHDKDEQFSFIFVKRQSDKVQTDFKHVYNLPIKRLAKVTMENARKKFTLSYLNSYNVNGKYKFSAVYTNSTTARGLLEPDQPPERASEIVISNLLVGLVPKFIVPWVNDKSEVRLMTYFQDEKYYSQQ